MSRFDFPILSGRVEQALPRALFVAKGILSAVGQRFGLLIALALALSASVTAASLSGIWTGSTVDRNGDPQDISFRFTQTGDAITGKMYGDNESTPISEGKISGDTIRFVIITELNGQISKTIYTGHIVHSEKGAGEEIEMNREREGATYTAERPKPGPFRLRRVT